jgi:hypothetical protein
MAESFVGTLKSELVQGRTFTTRFARFDVELAVVEYVGWFNHARLHEALGDLPPVEFEHLHAAKATMSGKGSVAALSPKPADRLYAPRLERERASEPRQALSGPADPRLAGFAGSTHT